MPRLILNDQVARSTNVKFDFQAVGIIRSCFPEKFGIPRQPGLVKEATATLELLPPYDRIEALEGLEAFSHLWLIFVFHASLKETWKPTVKQIPRPACFPPGEVVAPLVSMFLSGWHERRILTTGVKRPPDLPGLRFDRRVAIIPA